MSNVDIRRCTDADLLTRIMCDPSIYPWIVDDASPSADEFRMPEAIAKSNADLFLIPYVDNTPAGFTWFRAENAVMCSYHGGLLPGYRGKQGLTLVSGALRHFFECTSYRKVIAMCPEVNRAAQRFNRAIGMQREGRITKAFSLDGELCDLIVYGITEKELCQH